MYDRPLGNMGEQRAKSKVEWHWTICQIDYGIKAIIPLSTKAKNPKEMQNEKKEY